MTNSHGKTQSNSVGDASMVFPILMRLPDLRSNGDVLVHAESEPTPVAARELPATQVRDEVEVPVATLPTTKVTTATASEQVSPVEQKKNVPPVEPLTATAQRRQRALERQRRLETETTPRSWWTSHAPVLAVGFLIALVITVVMARNNREQPTLAEQARMEPPTPELNIEIGGPSMEMSSPGTPLAAPPQLIGTTPTASVEAMANKPSSKLPELLAASPKDPDLEPQTTTTVSAETTLPPLPEERVAAKAPVTEPAAPPASMRTSEFPNGPDGYPSTEAGSFGLSPPAAPSSAAEPTYPATSTPNSWR